MHEQGDDEVARNQLVGEHVPNSFQRSTQLEPRTRDQVKVNEERMMKIAEGCSEMKPDCHTNHFVGKLLHEDRRVIYRGQHVVRMRIPCEPTIEAISSPKIDVWEFLAQVGAILGTWVGFSVMTTSLTFVDKCDQLMEAQVERRGRFKSIVSNSRGSIKSNSMKRSSKSLHNIHKEYFLNSRYFKQTPYYN